MATALFQVFTEERKVGDRPIIVKVELTLFFEKGPGTRG